MSQKITVDDQYRARVIRYATWIGLIVNVVLSLLKCSLGYLGNSQAVIADGIHSLSDLVTDLAILVGVKFWSAPADKKHPYGHQRYETMVTVFIGCALALAGLALGYNAVASFIEGAEQQTPSVIAAVAALLSIVFKEWLYRWTVKKGGEVRSSSLQANAHHHRSDALSSVPVFIAVIIAVLFPEWTFVDALGAVVVSVFILRTAFNVMIEAFTHLSDTSAPEEDIQQIKELVLGVEGVLSTHKIRTRLAGYGVFVDLHVQVDGEMSVVDGHDVSRVVNRTLKEDGPDVVDVVVHLEPYVEGDENI